MLSVLQILYTLAHQFVQLLEPILIPLCFVLAWAIVILTCWNVVVALRDGVSRVQQMHQIPCAHCRFFTGDYHLKCPVRPTIALSEEAIDCPDYESAPALFTPEP